MQKVEELTYTVSELAQVLKIGTNSAYDLVNSKGFPVISIGRKKLIPKDALKKWLESESLKYFC